LKEFWRSLSGAQRTLWVVLLGGSTLMVIYVYQGHHSFYTRHLAAPLFGADPYNDWYRHLYQFLAALLLLAAIPALSARLFLGEGLRAQGVGLGDWRFGLKAVGVGIVVLTPILYFGSFDLEIQREYPLTRLAGCATDLFILWELSYLGYYIAWEYFFRGFNLFLLEKHWGAAPAILYQTVPSTLLHIGKPESETMAAIAGGILFGALAIRTRSMLYPLLLHWYVGACTDFFSLYNMVR
jgi:membrane protease YdiL (CAAX protease family)